MVIRHAANADFDAIAEITNHFILTTTIHFGLVAESPEAMRSAWLESCERYPHMVIEHPGSGVLGCAKAYRWRARAAYDRTAEVGIYIRPGFESRGLGRALYSALIQECKSRNFHTLVAGIALPNEPSLHLHARLGFTHVGTFSRVGRKFDRWIDLSFHQLLL